MNTIKCQMRILNIMRIGEKSMGGLDCTLNGANVIYYYASQRHRWVQKSYFCSKFARKLCTINPTGKCVLPKWEPNKIYMCRVNKTLFLHIFEGKVGSMSQSQRHRWVQWHPHTPLLTKVNATVQINVPCPLTPCSPKSTVPLGWLPPLNCKLNYYSMALGWISQRLRPKVNGTVELDTTLKCTPLPKVNATVGLDKFHTLPKATAMLGLLCCPPKLPFHDCMVS